MTLVNVAPIGFAQFSSVYSKFVPNFDLNSQLLKVDCVNKHSVSFHTEKETCPWLIIDLNSLYKIKKIVVTNRLDGFQSRAKFLRIECSKNVIELDQGITEILYNSEENWGRKLEIDVDVVARYFKLLLNNTEYFHLFRVELFSDFYELIDPFFYEKDVYCKIFYEFQNLFDNNFVLCLDKINSADNILSFSYRNIDFCDCYFFLVLNSSKLSLSLVVNASCLFSFSEFKNLLIDFAQVNHFNIIFDPNFVSFGICENVSIQFVKEKFLSILHEFYPFLCKLVFCAKKFSVTMPSRHKGVVIIDADLVPMGFSDKFRGILAIVKLCDDLGFDYYIKFNKPFNLSKYYNYKNADVLDLEHSNNSSKIYMPFLWNNHLQLGINRDECYTLISNFLCSTIDKYDFVFVGTNLDFAWTEKTYLTNFLLTDFLYDEILKYKNCIGDNYISISFRFLGCLGDFNEPNAVVLSDCEQLALMDKCRNELKNFIDSKDKIIFIASDSAKFLSYISDLPRVCTFPSDQISHVVNCNEANKNSEASFLRTLVDFNLILDASESFLFKTSKSMYRSGFPVTACRCSGRKIIHHFF